MAELILKPGREKSLLRLHPWIYSGAVEVIKGDPKPGETITILDEKKHFLASAAYSPVSSIRARVWSFVENETIDEEFFSKRIDKALSIRSIPGLVKRHGDGELDGKNLDAMRLIHAESDHLPGLIVDRYGDALVFQSLTAGSEYWREVFADLLMQKTGAGGIYERSDADVREMEGLPVRKGLLRGNVEQVITLS
ncbi:MAG: 23S rRNA (cytosine(1962)-C(5))-methyltransferase RlmI, partial [Chloroflexota bacterium]